MNRSPLRVLLVEDNAGDARLLREMFRTEPPGSFELTHLLRMSEAVNHLEKGGVDIVLLDLGLPDGHGLATVQRAKAVAPEVPVIVLTGLDDETLAAEAMKEGAQDYLIKGQIENRALPRALRHAIERHRMQAETEQIRAHQRDELAESERQFSDMLGNMDLLSLMLDRNACITYCSDYLLRLTGWQRDEVLGRDWFSQFIPAGRDEMKTALAALLAGAPTTSHHESEILTRSGALRLIQWNNSILHSVAGEVIGTASIGTDITQHRQMDRMKSEFISTVSHELRTPLTSIRGALGLIAAGVLGKLPDKAESMVKIAHQNAQRLVRIINDILDIERMESSNLELHVAQVPVAEFLQQALEGHQDYGEKYQVRFVLEPVAASGAVLADADRLMQVMANLLSNAAKFSTPGGEVQVRARMQASTWRFEVEDHGMGIPEDFQGRIFEKFAQAESSASRRFEGTGLGLSITRQLVQAMGGTIGFRSIPGRGTTFHFELPEADPSAQQSTVTMPAIPDPAASNAANAGATAGNSTRPRILHVEDDTDLSNVIEAAIGDRADLVNAPTLRAAQRLLRDEVFALIVLDSALPDGSGLSLLDWLPQVRAHVPPVVVLSTVEISREVQNRVAATLVKSRVSETNIVRTILSLMSEADTEPAEPKQAEQR